MAVLKPKRGEVRWINFDPSEGSETQKTRPAIIVSNNSANKYLSRFQVIPLTSNIKQIYPSECLVLASGQKSKAMADQITTVDTIRVGKKISFLSGKDLISVEQIMKIQLGLD